MVESEKNFTTRAIMEKFPVEKCWEITAKILGTFAVLRGEKRIVTEMAKGEGIISLVLGVEKWIELDKKAWGEESGRTAGPWIKKTFNIPVDDAIGAAKLMWVAFNLACGPEWESEIVEKRKEKTILRTTKCPWIYRWKEQELDHDFVSCYPIHEAIVKSALKVVNPKISYEFTKAMPRGDPYCEGVYELKEE